VVDFQAGSSAAVPWFEQQSNRSRAPVLLLLFFGPS
jgi:hypothetical protein